MVKEFLFFLFLFFFQISCWPLFFQFPKYFKYFNFPLIFLIGVNILEEKEKKSGIFLAFLGGFLFDIFSEKTFGLFTLSFLLFALLIKYFLKKNVWLS